MLVLAASDARRRLELDLLLEDDLDDDFERLDEGEDVGLAVVGASVVVFGRRGSA